MVDRIGRWPILVKRATMYTIALDVPYTLALVTFITRFAFQYLPIRSKLGNIATRKLQLHNGIHINISS